MLTGSSALMAQQFRPVTEPKFKIEIGSGSYTVSGGIGLTSTSGDRSTAISFKDALVYYYYYEDPSSYYLGLNSSHLTSGLLQGNTITQTSHYNVGSSSRYEYTGQFLSTGETLLFTRISGPSLTTLKRMMSNNGTTWGGETTIYNSGGSAIYGFAHIGESLYYILEQQKNVTNYNFDLFGYHNVPVILKRYNLTGSTLVLSNINLPFGSPNNVYLTGVSYVGGARLLLQTGSSQSYPGPYTPSSVKYFEITENNEVVSEKFVVDEQFLLLRLQNVKIGKSIYRVSMSAEGYDTSDFYIESADFKNWSNTKSGDGGLIAGSSGTSYAFCGQGSIYLDENVFTDVTQDIISYSNNSDERITLTLGNKK